MIPAPAGIQVETPAVQTERELPEGEVLWARLRPPPPGFPKRQRTMHSCYGPDGKLEKFRKGKWRPVSRQLATSIAGIRDELGRGRESPFVFDIASRRDVQRLYEEEVLRQNPFYEVIKSSMGPDAADRFMTSQREVLFGADGQETPWFKPGDHPEPTGGDLRSADANPRLAAAAGVPSAQAMDAAAAVAAATPSGSVDLAVALAGSQESGDERIDRIERSVFEQNAVLKAMLETIGEIRGLVGKTAPEPAPKLAPKPASAPARSRRPKSGAPDDDV